MSKRYVEVELGDSVRKLRYDFNAVVDLEDYFGKGIASILSQEQVGFQALRALYWAGLKWRNGKLTLQQVGLWLQQEIESGTGLDRMFEPVVKALEVSGLLGKANSEEPREVATKKN